MFGCSSVNDTPLQSSWSSLRASSNDTLVSRRQVRLVMHSGSELRSGPTEVFALEWTISVVVPAVFCQATAPQPQKQQGKHLHVDLPDISQLSPQLQQDCPYCEGRKVCEHSSLATQALRQTRYWKFDKNAKTPEQLLAGSGLRAEWKCPACSYEWQGHKASLLAAKSWCIGSATSAPREGCTCTK